RAGDGVGHRPVEQGLAVETDEDYFVYEESPGDGGNGGKSPALRRTSISASSIGGAGVPASSRSPARINCVKHGIGESRSQSLLESLGKGGVFGAWGAIGNSFRLCCGGVKRRPPFGERTGEVG